MSANSPRTVEAGMTVGEVLRDADRAIRAGSPFAPRLWPTGFVPLDMYLGGGLRAGELILLGGPQGLGKTTFALQLARNAAAAGYSATYVCYEHGERELLERLLGMEAGLIAGGEAITLSEARAALREERVCEGGLAERLGERGAGAQAVEAIAGYGDRLRLVRAFGSRTGIDELRQLVDASEDRPVIVVDYLQKVAMATGDVEEERVTLIVEALKDLALDCAVPVVAIVAADSQGIAKGRTRLHHLRGSSALAYEADVALMLNGKHDIVARHHIVYDLVAAERFRNWVICSIEKNRSGLDQIDLEFRKHFDQGRFDPNGQSVVEQLLDDRVFVD
jgi:replicative DNA helicase